MEDDLERVYCIYIILLLCLSKKTIGMSLDQVFEHIEKNNLTVKNAKIDVEIAQSQKEQAISEVLPQLSINHTSYKEENDDTTTTNKLSLSQQLFAGGGEYKAIQIANNLNPLAINKQKSILSTMKLKAANSYFLILQLEDEKKLLNTQRKSIEKSIKELSKRVKIGRNRSIDIFNAKSQISKVDADIASIDSKLTDSYSQLSQLVQLAISSIDKVDLNWEKLNPQSLVKPIENNPDFKTLELEFSNAELSTLVEKADHLPTISLDGNYYFNRDTSSSTANWDLSLTASWSLYSGGKDSSEVQEMIYEKLKKENELNIFKWNWNQKRASYLKQFQLKKISIQKLVEAEKINEVNYKEHLKELKLGLISPLEVYRAEESFVQIQRSLVQEKYNLKSLWYEYKSFLGDDL